MTCHGVQDSRITEQEDLSDVVMRLEHLPVEVSEVIFSNLRPADLLALAASSPHLEAVTRSARLWRRTKLELSGNDTRPFLRQIELAPELHDLKLASGRITRTTAETLSRYTGPTPLLQTLRLTLSVLGTDLGVALLKRHAPKARHLELDLRHDHLEPPRDNIALIKLLPDLDRLETLTVRTDVINDIVVLSQLAVALVELDIHRLRVGDLFRGGPGPAVGATASHLISRHVCHLQTLRLPTIFDANLTAVVMTCRALQTLACNVWTLPAIEDLSLLHSLLVFPPDQLMTSQDILVLISYARRCRTVLSKLKELRFVNSDDICDIVAPLASNEIAQAVMCTFLAICKSLEVIEVQWKIKENSKGVWSWLDTVLSNNSFHLRELWLHGNFLSPRYMLLLAKFCPNLEILDMRKSVGCSNTGGTVTSKRKFVDVTTRGQAAMRRAVELLQDALPKLTILFDDRLENYYDWNCYLPCDGKPGTENYLTMRPFEANSALPKDSLDRLFLHLLSLDEWTTSGGFQIPQEKDFRFWRCATIDSFLWSSQHITDILSVIPALGLLDLRNGKTLHPGKKGNLWFKDLVHGPTDIQALRIRAALVSACLWGQIELVLLRTKKSLRCLELDFRGRTFRNWQNVLPTLGKLPNLSELVLRGLFVGDTCVLDLLHGQLRSLERLDLRDCLTLSSQMPVFLKSLKTLLLGLRTTLRAVALPPLPLSEASSVLRTLSELTDLREVALHANELKSLRPLTSLKSLELYGDRQPRNTIDLNRLASDIRHESDTLRKVKHLTLPADLVKSQLVREALNDVMPNLRKLHLLDVNRKMRVCAEGPQCRHLLSKLV